MRKLYNVLKHQETIEMYMWQAENVQKFTFLKHSLTDSILHVTDILKYVYLSKQNPINLYKLD